MTACLETAESARRFALAGDARLTLTSARTGARYTYRVSRSKRDQLSWFVSLLTGPDNEGDYAYLGMLSGDPPIFHLTKASKMAVGAKPVEALKFFVNHVLVCGSMPRDLGVRHEGRCGRCGRTLTTPESIDRGIGPECWEKMQ